MLLKRLFRILIQCAIFTMCWAGATFSCDHPETEIVIGQHNWNSARFHASVVEYLLRNGLGCKVSVRHGTTKAIWKGLSDREIHITLENWPGVRCNKDQTAWQRALENGIIIYVGIVFSGAQEHFYLPRYSVQEIEKQTGLSLRSVFNLKGVANYFSQDESLCEDTADDRPIFINCAKGWNCVDINNKKISEYGIDKKFCNYVPETPEILEKTVQRLYNQKNHFVTYYWTPSWLVQSLDLVALDEPEGTQSDWDRFLCSEAGGRAIASPPTNPKKVVNQEFARKNPIVMEVINNYEISIPVLQEYLVIMRDENDPRGKIAARRFLNERPEIWESWLPIESDAVNRVWDKLNDSQESN